MRFFNNFLIVALFVGINGLEAQNADTAQQEIIRVLETQTKAWNEGDIEGFMSGYWDNDSLRFIGKKGLTFGWKPVLENYKKSYPGKAGMGTLNFEKLQVELLCEDAAFVTGSWKLSYPDKDSVGGWFSLLFKKINGHWLIVADHSS
ncbi:MAG: nuclear transport factor 2 family protein [Bacteroidetes bacterium]|nr:nuclear transport factor 2 family protein [Bacteroidota bacterium]